MTIKRYTSFMAGLALTIALTACSDSSDVEDQSTGPAAADQTTSADDDADTGDPDGGDEAMPATQTPGQPSTVEPAPSSGETTESGDANIPTNAVDYADALVVAWGNGNREMIERLATAEVRDILGEMGGPSWDRTASDSGAGSVFVTYENLADGRTLELRVQNERASMGEEQAVIEAKFG